VLFFVGCVGSFFPMDQGIPCFRSTLMPSYYPRLRGFQEISTAEELDIQCRVPLFASIVAVHSGSYPLNG